MKFDRAAFAVVRAFALTCAVPVAAWAGGAGFTFETTNPGGGPAFFGFVRQVGGVGIANATVTASVKNSGAMVTHSDILGLYKFPGLGKTINPANVTISCAKDGYKEANVVAQPHTSADATQPYEVECYLQKN
jgi:hypothetical protein